jgi:hypothetical protein
MLLLLKSLENNGFNALSGGTGHVIRHSFDETFTLLCHSLFLSASLIVKIDS